MFALNLFCSRFINLCHELLLACFLTLFKVRLYILFEFEEWHLPVLGVGSLVRFYHLRRLLPI